MLLKSETAKRLGGTHAAAGPGGNGRASLRDPDGEKERKIKNFKKKRSEREESKQTPAPVSIRERPG